MNRSEFGFETHDLVEAELHKCNSQVNTAELDNDSKAFKFVPDSRILFSSIGDFFSHASELPGGLWAKLSAYTKLRRSAYGMDAVACIQTQPQRGVNDYELNQIRSIFGGSNFEVRSIKKDNRANNFMMINRLAARKVVQNHPDLFDDFAKHDIVRWIDQNLLNKISERAARGKPVSNDVDNFPDVQYGLLSGFPRQSVLLYPAFDTLKRKYPVFANAYTKFLYQNLPADNVVNVIKRSGMTKKDESFLLGIVSQQARFNDRSVIQLDDFDMLSKEDLAYAQRRHAWFMELERIYAPLMRMSNY